MLTLSIAHIKLVKRLPKHEQFYLSPDEAAVRTDPDSSARRVKLFRHMKHSSPEDGMRGAAMPSSCIVRSKPPHILGEDRPWVALSLPGDPIFAQARTFKSVEPKPDLLIHPDVGAKKRPPTALQVTHWITFKEEQRLDWQKAYLARLGLADQEIAQTAGLIQSETPMRSSRQGEQLDSWLTLQ